MLVLESSGGTLELSAHWRSWDNLLLGPVLPILPWFEEVRHRPPLVLHIYVARAGEPVELRADSVRLVAPVQGIAAEPDAVSLGRLPVDLEPMPRAVFLREGEGAWLEYRAPSNLDRFNLELRIPELALAHTAPFERRGALVVSFYALPFGAP